MKLHPDWRLILRHAWSVRFMALAALIDIVAQVFPFFGGALPLNDRQIGLIEMALLIAALLARFVFQKPLSGE